MNSSTGEPRAMEPEFLFNPSFVRPSRAIYPRPVAKAAAAKTAIHARALLAVLTGEVAVQGELFEPRRRAARPTNV